MLLFQRSHLHLFFFYTFRSFKRYISSHGASIQKTKLFLERESSRLVERQAALKKAQSGSSLVPDQEGALAEDVLRSLQQVRDSSGSVMSCESNFQRAGGLFFSLSGCGRRPRR